MTEEIWKCVTNYEGYYEVSSLGRLRSLDRYRRNKGGGLARVAGKMLKPNLNKDGYYTLHLHKRNARKGFLLSRLVAREFCDGYSPELQANHKDLNRINNTYTNLEWITLQQNLEHCQVFGAGSRVKPEVISRIQMLKLERKTDAEIAKITGVGETTVYGYTRHLGVNLQSTPQNLISDIRLRRWALGEPYARIARHFGVNVKTVVRHCKDISLSDIIAA